MIVEVLLLLLVVALVEVEGRPNCNTVADRVIYGPTMQSPDYLSLFNGDVSSSWPFTIGVLSYFQFYGQQLIGPCPSCNGNDWAALQSVGAMHTLQQFGVDIGVEIGSIKDYDCNGDNGNTLNAAITAWTNVHNVGAAQVRYIVMDEPLWSAMNPCRVNNMTQIALTVAQWIQRVKGNTTADLLIGDVEPYPAFSASQLCAWIQQLHAVTPLPFFHLDVDFHAIHKHQNPVADIAQIKACADALGISFGGIINSLPAQTDTEYVSQSLQNLATYQKSVGRLANVMFESWNTNGTPKNLPESDSSASHTGLIKSACSA